jgi:hypothetical protein
MMKTFSNITDFEIIKHEGGNFVLWHLATRKSKRK